MEPLVGGSILALIKVFSVLFFTIALLRASQSTISFLPGPWASKWTGLILQYHSMKGNKAKYIHDLHRKYGRVVRVSPDEADISDPEAARKIHRVGSGFLKSAWYQALTIEGENVFNIRDPKCYNTRRRLLSTPLSNSSLQSVEPIVNSRARLAIQKMRDEMKSRGAADVYKWWTFMTADLTGELTFGESFRMLEKGETNQYIKDLQTLNSMQGFRSIFSPITPLLDLIPGAFCQKISQAGSRLLLCGEQLIQRYREQMALGNHRPTLFSKLFDAGLDGLSDAAIKDEAVNFIIAGSDTTASALTYLVWAVCRDDKVRESLLRDLAPLPEDFSDRGLRQLPYLDHVINETLRLYAPVPTGLPRTVPNGGANLAGHWIPAGVTVTTQAYSLHRDPSVFRKPERFDPSRWATPTAEMKDAFMAFGGMSRICLGQHLARMELRLATAYFFRTFPNARISALEGMGDLDMDPVIQFLMSPRGKRCLVQDS
ncbi:cytochrome P450 [Aspergillus egyptiacus]|nr:cytochrome P450 [Aspergillus egyptiacus]